jgi:hypothetical protein
MNYKGVIIEESLSNSHILNDVTVLKTRKEKVTPKHKTPWLTQWTLHTIKIPEENMDTFADVLSKSFETQHPVWYIDFKNDTFHFIIFPNKVFKINLKNPVLYKSARQYGESLGIPPYQMQFERLKR